MYYQNPQTISTNTGNNTFAFSQRIKELGKAEITIPHMTQGNLKDVKIGKHITFNEYKNGKINQFYGLEKLVQIKSTNIYIIDNHNHALYCRYKGLQEGVISKGINLIHIDQHSDMSTNPETIDLEKENNLSYIAQYTNKFCNVGNFIQPAIQSGLIGEIIQIRTEQGLLNLFVPPNKEGEPHRGGRLDQPTKPIYHGNDEPFKPFILDIDLDFRDPQMGITQQQKTIKIVQKLISKASLTTIATSPYFLDQILAIQLLNKILG